MAEGSIAKRLQSIDSGEDLDRVLRELASSHPTRWKRTQVLYYLPRRWHGLARRYFEGEELRLDDAPPSPSVAFKTLGWQEALAAVLRDAPEGIAATPLRSDPRPVPSAWDLVADPPRGDDDVIGNVLDALREEIVVIDRESPKTYRLVNGRCTGPQSGGFGYVFEWSSEPDLLVPGEFRLDKQRSSARVIRQADGERRFELLIDKYFGPDVAEARFRIDPSFLNRALFQKLKERRDVFDSSSRLGPALFHPPLQHVPRANVAGVEQLTMEQALAIATASQCDRTYIWGPPGTGKTYTLGAFVAACVRRGERVLIVSPYNVAVDQAILSAARATGLEGADIVRFGRISDEVRRARLDLNSHLEQRAAASGLLDSARSLVAAVAQRTGSSGAPPMTVQGCLDELGHAIVELYDSDKDASRELQNAVNALRIRFRAPEQKILENARVVGTTVALSYVSPLFEKQVFTQIIVDESSVLRLPESLIVALGEPKRLSFFGDPNQLWSIVRTDSEKAKRWLKPNPFDLAGIKSTNDARGACVLLPVQHRMAPPIRQLVSKLFYDDKLRDGNCPTSGALLLIDSSHTPARMTTKWVKMSASKENVTHRNIVGELLYVLKGSDPDGSVLVLSPFKAQQRAYASEAKTNRHARVKFGTIHSSQGSECETVILDLVFAPGKGKSRFLNSRRNPELKKMINVGLSRAKRRLIIIAHRSSIEEEFGDDLLGEVTRYVAQHGELFVVPSSMNLGSIRQLSILRAT